MLLLCPAAHCSALVWLLLTGAGANRRLPPPSPQLQGFKIGAILTAELWKVSTVQLQILSKTQNCRASKILDLTFFKFISELKYCLKYHKISFHWYSATKVFRKRSCTHVLPTLVPSRTKILETAALGWDISEIRQTLWHPHLSSLIFAVNLSRVIM